MSTPQDIQQKPRFPFLIKAWNVVVLVGYPILVKALLSGKGFELYTTAIGSLKIAGLIILAGFLTACFGVIGRDICRVSAWNSGSYFKAVAVAVIVSLIASASFAFRGLLIFVNIMDAGPKPPGFITWFFTPFS